MRASLESQRHPEPDDGTMEQAAPPAAQQTSPDSFIGLPIKVSDFLGDDGEERKDTEPMVAEGLSATAMTEDDATDEDVKEEELPKAKRKAKVVPKRGNKYVFRLVGPDKLLVKACPFRSAKQDKAVVIWPVVVPDTMVPAIMGLFHATNPLLGMAVSTRPTA